MGVLGRAVQNGVTSGMHFRRTSEARYPFPVVPR